MQDLSNNKDLRLQDSHVPDVFSHLTSLRRLVRARCC